MKQRIRRLTLAAGCMTLVGALIIAGFIVALTLQLAPQTLDPRPRTVTLPPDTTLTDVRDVEFTTTDGVTLRGWYVLSQHGAAVLLAHGYGADRRDLFPEAELLHAAGYGVLLFDLRGHGESDPVQRTVGDRERHGIRAAVDWLSAQPYVDPARIGAICFSKGAAAVVGAAADDDRLQAVVIEASFDTLDAVIRANSSTFGPLTLLPARWAIRRAGVDIDDVRPVDDLCRISPRPVLLIYGDQDGVVPPGAAAAMFAAACDPAETWLISGAGHHNYTQTLPDEYPARLIAFFERWLR
ncbi:MAG: alpha/beta fold hydrolase [Anaerolineae bacterium]|nr:alpha/beta fold hydrolase [Anaerolineae bacterium]